jgi:hypothetical protein
MEAEVERRQEAIKRLKDKRAFGQNVVAYVVVNAFLVGIWAIGDRGYFWPAWVMAGWGIGLVMHAYTVFFQHPITEDEIQREMRRGGDAAA